MITLHDFVVARLYASEDDVVRDALRCLLRSRPELRIQLALHRYQTQSISLAKAASLAGVSYAQMQEILQTHGLQPRLGPESLEDAQKEVEALQKYFEAGQ